MQQRTVFTFNAQGQLERQTAPVGRNGWALVHTQSADRAKSIHRMAQRLVAYRAAQQPGSILT